MVKELHGRVWLLFKSLPLSGAHSCSLSRWSCCISVSQNNFPVCTRRGPPGSLHIYKMLSESKYAGRVGVVRWGTATKRGRGSGCCPAAASLAGTIKAEPPRSRLDVSVLQLPTVLQWGFLWTVFVCCWILLLTPALKECVWLRGGWKCPQRQTERTNRSRQKQESFFFTSTN